MKQYMMDLCLVLLFICVIGLFFDDYHVSQTMFQRSIDDFEEKVSSQQNISTQYVTLQETADNQVSHFFKGLSDICVHIIEYIVLIFSNFISMILTVMLY